MEQSRQEAVAAVVWPWRGNAGGSVPGAPAKSPRGRAAVQAGVMAVIGLLVRFGLDKPAMANVVWGLAGLVLGSGLFFPPAFFALERFGARLGHWTGAILTWGLLVPFYYVCFVPGRLAQKLLGQDPLRRAFGTSEPTYWTPRKPVADVAQYRKQF